MHTETSEEHGTWADLFRGGAGPISLVLAGGVALYALTVYVTGALLPALSAELHGVELYAWVNTAYLTASVLASALSGRASIRLGTRGAYLIGFGLFALGSVIIMLAPAMLVVVAGRLVQGLGGGFLAALAYVSISALLPRRVWTRATVLITAMWAIGGVAGPALGGAFASAGVWREAFLILTIAAVLLGLMALIVIRAPRPEAAGMPGLAVGSLVLVVVAAVLFSIATVVIGGWQILAVVLGALALVLFVVVEKRAGSALLPAMTFRRGSNLKWVYLVAGLIGGSVMIESFVPLFAQEIGNVPALPAGYLGAVPSLGWTVAEIFSAMIAGTRARLRARTIAPFITVAGLAGFALVSGTLDGVGVLIGWIVTLALVGIGVGIGFPHLSVAAMSSVEGEEEQAAAASGVSTVQLLSNAIVTALAGILLGTSVAGLTSAQVVSGGLAILVAVSIPAALLVARRLRTR
ncbi:MFS transporter, partial [Mycetocola saprophilus]|uniref:MFS transporter n=1 Tax=Mycetocola saprophilus TaxID=76636 RepID=UPI0004BF93A8